MLLHPILDQSSSLMIEFDSKPQSAVSSFSSGKRPGVFDKVGQERVGDDFFPNSSELRDNRLDNTNLPTPDSPHKRTRESQLLKNHRPRLVPVDTLQQRPSGFSAPGDELQNFCEEGQLDRELDILVRTDKQGSVPSVKIFSSLLRACGNRKALSQAQRVRAHLAKHGLDCSRFLGEYVVSTLVKCGGLQDAIQVFHRLAHRTVFSWTAVISGYTDCGQGQEALRLYRQMQDEGVQPNTYTFVALIRACGSIADLDEGHRIHAEATSHGCGTHLFVRTCLVDMYGKCGSILEAQEVFDGLSHRDVVAWTTMVAACAQQGQSDKALQLYEHMLEDGASPNARTFVTVLQACSILAESVEEGFAEDRQSRILNCLAKGKAIHAEARKKGYDPNVFVGSTLVSMYGKCGSIVDAQFVFDGLSERNVVSWNAMLGGYAQHGAAERTLDMYEQMLQEGVSPNVLTFVTVLQACGMVAQKDTLDSTEVQCLEQGKALHADVWRKGYDSDVFVGNTLISMYGKCGSILDAQNVFDGLPLRDVVSWNAMLGAYVQQGQANETLQQYVQMCKEAVESDVWTFVAVLEACGMLAEKEEGAVLDGQCMKADSLKVGKAIHADAKIAGFASDAFVSSILISMYGKCSSISDAEKVFEGISQWSLVGWTAMITAYAQHGQGEMALQLYRKMQEEGVSPDEIALVSILRACSSTGSLNICRQIHLTFASEKTSSNLVANCLIHAYSRCASMVDAQAVFDAVPQPGVVSWTTLIAGYALEGNFAASLQCYDKMQLAGIHPNEVTFLSLLSACSHAGLVDKGVEYFESMTKGHGIAPGIEHYVSFLDLLGRVGDFTSVEHLLSTMPMKPDFAMWSCLLGACQKHGNVVLGKQAFDSAVHLHPDHSASYVMMSNIYADAGLWDHAKEVELSRQRVGARKKPGQSWLEHQQEQHRFVVGDRNKKQQVPDRLRTHSHNLACI